MCVYIRRQSKAEGKGLSFSPGTHTHIHLGSFSRPDHSGIMVRAQDFT